MRNRLQIKYYMPSTFPYKREDAIKFIENLFSTNANINTTQKTSLPAEPIAVFYGNGNSPLDSNVILAIGRGGNGEEYGHNLPYFLIDTARIDEDLSKVGKDLDSVTEIVNTATADIEQMKVAIKEAQDGIDAIWKKIGSEADTAAHKTIFGYINDKVGMIMGGVPVDGLVTINDIGNAILRIRTRLNNLVNANNTLAERLGKVEDSNFNLWTNYEEWQTEINDLVKKIDEEVDEKIGTLPDGYSVAQYIREEIQKREEEDERVLKGANDYTDAREEEIQKYADDAVGKADANIRKDMHTLEDNLKEDATKKADNAIKSANEYTDAREEEITEDYQRYANDLNTQMDVRVATLEAQDVYVKKDVDQQISDAQDAAISGAKKYTNEREVEITNAYKKYTNGAISGEVTRADAAYDTKGSAAAAQRDAISAAATDATTKANAAQAAAETTAAADATSKANAAQAAAISAAATDATNKVDKALADAKLYTDSAEDRLTVKSTNKSIVVGAKSLEGTDLSVNIDGKTLVRNDDGILSVASDKLVQYDGVNSIKVSKVNDGIKRISLKVNENEQVISDDADGLTTTLSLKWVKGTVDGVKDEIQLIGKGDAIISRIDVADFIKDGMLEKVDFITEGENKILRFTWNVAAGIETTDINVNDLIDVYTAGNGLELIGSEFRVKLSELNENQFLSIDENGIRLSGVKSYVDALKTEVNNNITTLSTELSNERTARTTEDSAINGKIGNLTAALSGETEARKGDVNKLSGDINTLTTALSTTDNEVTKINDTILGLTSRLEGEISTREGADNKLSGDINTLTTALSAEKTDRENADNTLTESISALNAILSGETAARTNADNTLTESISALNANLVSEVSTREGADNLLSERIGKLESDTHTHINKQVLDNITTEKVDEWNNILNNANSNADSKDTIVKKDVYGSLVSTIVTNITPEDAASQTLIRKIITDGDPIFYVTNDSNDILHNGETLHNVIETIKENNGLKNKVEALEKEVETLRQSVASFELTIKALGDKIDGIDITVDMDAIKAVIIPEAVEEAEKTILPLSVEESKKAIISSDVFKAVNGELVVNVGNDTVTYGFDENAIFKAGDNSNEPDTPEEPEEPIDIIFYVNGQEYQAEENMTWSAWIDSPYRNANFILSNDTIKYQDGDGKIGDVKTMGNVPVYGTDRIIDEYDYKIVFPEPVEPEEPTPDEPETPVEPEEPEIQEIKFYINFEGVEAGIHGKDEYTALNGMTWREWIDSSYCTNIDIIEGNMGMIYTDGIGDIWSIIDNENFAVQADYLIDADYVYRVEKYFETE